MRIQFLDAPQSPAPRFVARVVDQDALPADLDPVLAEGARAARFTGKAAQVHEGFVQGGGQVVRVALAGLGEKAGTGRAGAIERAGAALSGKYLASGETSLTVDLAGSSLTPCSLIRTSSLADGTCPRLAARESHLMPSALGFSPPCAKPPGRV